MKNLHNNDIIYLNPDVLIRFERNVQDGVLFLFNINTKEFWIGNESTFDLIKSINYTKIDDLYDYACNFYKDFDINTIKNSINVILLELISKKFLLIQ